MLVNISQILSLIFGCITFNEVICKAKLIAKLAMSKQLSCRFYIIIICLSFLGPASFILYLFLTCLLSSSMYSLLALHFGYSRVVFVGNWVDWLVLKQTSFTMFQVLAPCPHALDIGFFNVQYVS